jgi:hypothetical protein
MAATAQRRLSPDSSPQLSASPDTYPRPALHSHLYPDTHMYTNIYIYIYIYIYIATHIYICIHMARRAHTHALDITPHSYNIRFGQSPHSVRSVCRKQTGNRRKGSVFWKTSMGTSHMGTKLHAMASAITAPKVHRISYRFPHRGQAPST